jgi:hypothetical protein
MAEFRIFCLPKNNLTFKIQENINLLVLLYNYKIGLGTAFAKRLMT